MQHQNPELPERPNVVISREELYRQAWAMPMRELSELHGLSERALRKICSIHLIPIPPANYWKNEEGAPAQKSKLGKVANTALHSIVLAERYTAPRGDYLQAVLSAVGEQETVTPVGRPKPKPKVIQGMSVVTGSESRAVEAMVEVANDKMKERPLSRARSRDPNVIGFITKLRELVPDRDGFVHLKWVKVPPNKISRVADLLHNLADLLRTDGLVFVESRDRVGFARDGSAVNFEINFPRKQIMVPSRWSDYQRREYQHIGRMTFRIFGWAEGVRKNFNDGDTLTVEDSIDKLAASFRAAILHEIDQDARDRVAARERAHLAHRQELAALRSKREDDRRGFLQHVADVSREVEDLKTTISLLEQPASERPELDRMLTWAQQRLSSLSSAISPDRLASDLIERNLFPDPDDLSDPEGEP